jgi:parallel beta-helix repeat protein
LPTLGPGIHPPQDITSSETLDSSAGPSATFIVNPGGFYTFGVNVEASANNVQVGDLSGHGFTIEATNPGGSAVQILGTNVALEGNILSANDPTTNGNGADLITGSGANNLHIEGNTFGGTGFALAYVNGALDTYTSSTNVNFLNNTFSGVATAGVDLVDDAASGTISGNTFSGTGTSDGAIYLGHVSQAAADYYNGLYGTHYTSEAGTVTVANNDFSGWAGVDIITFDASYTFANGGAGQTLTSVIAANGQETDTLTGFVSGDHIDLRHGVTATQIQQHGKGEVDVKLSDGDLLVFQGNNIKAKDVAAALGVDTHQVHVDNGNHNGFDHSQHNGYDLVA